MVKFSKQFEAQLVPEWKDAFVDYWQLKKDLKRMQIVGDSKTEPSLFHRLFAKRIPFFGYNVNRDRDAIHVHRKLGSSASRNDFYETELFDQFADSESAKEFFSRLDLQLNKVNQFYKGKEKEYQDRSESLHKQMDILLELKAALKQQQQRDRRNLGTDSKDDPSICCSIVSEEDSTRGAIEQTEQTQENFSRELERLNSDQDQLSMSQRLDSIKNRREEGKKFRSLSGRVVSFQGKNVKINIPLTNPSRTFSALSDLVWEDLVNQSKKSGSETSMNKLSVNKTKLHHAEKMIRGAFIELYKGLGYLRTYRNLNMLAFVKILKKFDKVTQKQVSSTYLKVVESSYFNSSDKEVKLTDDVEELFIKNFAKDDKQKAMKYLKPHQRKESHAVTFFIGLFAGCFMALFTGYCIMAHLAGMYTSHSNSIYMETAYPVLSMFSLLFLHLFLYGCNIFMWRKMRINYTFIFEFSPTKELKYREVFLICTACMTVVVGAMFAHLALVLKGNSSTQVQAIPGILVLMFLLLLVCPFNVLYKSTRFLFLRILRNIVLSPLYKVVMVDFFMADQLCSQVPMLRSLEYVACYYITGSFKTQDYGYCNRGKHFRDLAYAISFLPYYWRAMQCARRWFDEGDMGHLINLGKYVSAMLAAGVKVAYEKEKSPGWLVLMVAMSSGATMYQLYWDFVKDWGLLQANSKNPWLRNDLILKRKFVYYLSMGLNLVLRLAWLQTVIHPNLGSLDSRVSIFFLAALEVIRRGHWNFYRLENEHLNNAGKFRAVKTVPLPFHEVDQD
ncbi:phosphate transporter PHO1-3 [Carex littledalei]|uniref:Phosphate transporter PHO1-3 n=1 Tax=Carex littledalei TaxID=544730 RepID=A0A833QXZ5_9POAL|nr:phosphate transporter PHO1-3 [Carex littledalei]